MAAERQALSKTQVDRLGDRLRTAQFSDADLRMLDAFRRSFAGTYQTVIDAIREKLGIEATGRPAKSTKSIVDKLQRDTIRLSQIQDIAGCRLVVDSIPDQDDVVRRLLSAFGRNGAVVDRRQKPSFGYRAVHVVVRLEGKAIEIQVRTALQHLWAELTEKLSDIVDPGIKYGQSTEEIAVELAATSEVFARFEEEEARLLTSVDVDDESADPRLESLQKVTQHKRELLSNMEELVRRLSRRKGR